MAVDIEFWFGDVLQHLRFLGRRAKTMETGELSLQEHLEKAWDGSYSCLDSGQHSQSEPKLQMGAILFLFGQSELHERPILNSLLILDCYAHPVV